MVSLIISAKETCDDPCVKIYFDKSDIESLLKCIEKYKLYLWD